MKKIYPYERKVYYYETDKMGIVHHSNYVRIFEEARMNFLEQIGMPYSKIESYGLLVPILAVDLNYKKALVFDEPFAVYGMITKFNGVRLDMNYKLVSRKTETVCITGSTSQCFTDGNLKPLRIKNKYPELYNTIIGYLNYEIKD